jgi:hypothetical protein
MIFLTEVSWGDPTYFFKKIIPDPFNSLHGESNSGLLGTTEVL